MAASEPTAFNLPKWDVDEVVAEVSSETVKEMPDTVMQEQKLVVSLEAPAIFPTTEPTPVAEPTPVDVVEQAASPVAELNYTTTNRPMALDFTKLGVTAKIEMQTDSPQSKPVAKVAGRSVPQLLNPTKR